MPSTEGYMLFDAGVFIGALLAGDLRHAEARPLVEAARRHAGVYDHGHPQRGLRRADLATGAAAPRPGAGAEAVRLLVKPPSMIRILPDGPNVTLRMLELAAKHHLRARRVHDARHAAAAIAAGVMSVFTYDAEDWESFEGDGLSVAGPTTTLARLGRS